MIAVPLAVFYSKFYCTVLYWLHLLTVMEAIFTERTKAECQSLYLDQIKLNFSLTLSMYLDDTFGLCWESLTDNFEHRPKFPKLSKNAAKSFHFLAKVGPYIHCIQKKPHSRFLLYICRKCLNFHKILRECFPGNMYSKSRKFRCSLLPVTSRWRYISMFVNSGFYHQRQTLDEMLKHINGSLC